MFVSTYPNTVMSSQHSASIIHKKAGIRISDFSQRKDIVEHHKHGHRDGQQPDSQLEGPLFDLESELSIESSPEAGEQEA